MRLTILTFGSRGDVQPYVALGVGLKQAGYTVRLAAPPPFASFIQSWGLEFMPIDGEPQAMLEGEIGQRWLENNGKNPLRLFSDYAEMVRPVLRQQFDCSLAACEDTEVMIYGPLAMAAPHIAEALNIPAFSGMLQPYTRTKAFPNCFTSPNLNLGPWYNWGSHVLMEKLYWQALGKPINQWRKDVFGLPSWPHAGHFSTPGHPILFGYSSAAIPKPNDWSSKHHVTGYWFLPDESNWQPSSALLDFLAAGEKPVYVGFGSMLNRCSERVTDNVIEALKRTGKRGILMKGWGGLSTNIDDDDIFTIDSIPHSWLFPQLAAIVHHGGAGTTSATLQAGVPMVIVPFLGDQPFWGHYMNKLGVAAPPIHQKNLTAEALTNAIATVTEDENIKARSRQLGEQIRAEDGIGNTIKLVDRYLQKKSNPTLIAV
ncbi:glycosyltransferase [Spirulina sp. 06S082]|uniref:glycosyltransferase n=1 Tax=Spirulina sp. 06S082 TaxID=3110248 RepID=UPI002B205818|nr:glycosyltransferase [Spirulina sp. 06S082]